MLPDNPELTKKKMLGGIGFLAHGNMAYGVKGEQLVVRISLDTTDVALAQSIVRLFAIMGLSMNGWIVVAPAEQQSADELQH